MARTGERSGPQTRARITAAAAVLFLERGFDGVTVAEVAQAAGVSSVTVFNHFPRKEDLWFDRSGDAADLLRSAIRDRAAGTDVLEALQSTALGLLADRHPLAAVDPRSVPFFRTVAESPTLVGRARAILAELQQVLADELRQDRGFDGDADLLATLFVAGYGAAMVRTARDLLAGGSADELSAAQRERLDHLFAALRSGVPI